MVELGDHICITLVSSVQEAVSHHCLASELIHHGLGKALGQVELSFYITHLEATNKCPVIWKPMMS